MEMSAPRVIQVFLLGDEAGSEVKATGRAAAGAVPARRVEPAARAPIPKAPPAKPGRPAARWVKRGESAKPEAPAPPIPLRPVAIAAFSQPAESPGGGAGEGLPESPPGAGGSGTGAALEGERDHRIAIIRRRIQEALVYPREARRRGIQGTSQVRFDLTAAGRLRTLALARSSGKKLLDDASLETLERAQPFPFIDGTLIVPVVFRLSDMRRP